MTSEIERESGIERESEIERKYGKNIRRAQEARANAHAQLLDLCSETARLCAQINEMIDAFKIPHDPSTGLPRDMLLAVTAQMRYMPLLFWVAAQGDPRAIEVFTALDNKTQTKLRLWYSAKQEELRPMAE
jgi:hypothetical protein